MRIGLPGGLKLANCRFEAISTNRSHVMKMVLLSAN